MSEVATTGDGPGRLLQTITELARDPNFDVAKFKALAELQITMEDRQAERILTQDLQAVQRELPRVVRNGRIPTGKGSIPFATYKDIMAVVQPLCDRYGFTIHFSQEPAGEKLITRATLRHPSGASVTATVVTPVDGGPGRNSTQAHGSSNTYGKRYAVKSLFNIVEEDSDDDASKAHDRVLTLEQAKELADLLKVEGGSEAALLTHFYGDACHSLEEAPAGDYGKLKQAIEARNRAVAKKRQEEESKAGG